MQSVRPWKEKSAFWSCDARARFSQAVISPHSSHERGEMSRTRCVSRAGFQKSAQKMGSQTAAQPQSGMDERPTCRTPTAPAYLPSPRGDEQNEHSAPRFVSDRARQARQHVRFALNLRSVGYGVVRFRVMSSLQSGKHACGAVARPARLAHRPCAYRGDCMTSRH